VYVTLPLTILVPPVACPPPWSGEEDVGTTVAVGFTFGEKDEQAIIARANTVTAAMMRDNKSFISLS
jgi:hypothetical protein